MSAHQIYNFSAGPAVLPEAVLRTAQQEMLDYNGTGFPVMAMSHRSDMFLSISCCAVRNTASGNTAGPAEKL